MLRTIAAPRRLAVAVIGVGTELVNRPFEHMTYLGWERHANFRHIDVKHRVKISVEIQSCPGQLRVLIDATDSVPAAPLHQPVSAVNINSLLAVPVKRSG